MKQKKSKNIETFSTITKLFLEVEEMQIPLYSIMKNEIDYFKYLLVNGFHDPNKAFSE